jgi:hypothetical protein
MFEGLRLINEKELLSYVNNLKHMLDLEVREECKGDKNAEKEPSHIFDALNNARGAINVIQRRIEDLEEVVIDYDFALNEGVNPIQIRGDRWGEL